MLGHCYSVAKQDYMTASLTAEIGRPSIQNYLNICKSIPIIQSAQPDLSWSLSQLITKTSYKL